MTGPNEAPLDTGDLVDDDALDPTPDEITDPADPDYVAPWADATPVQEAIG